jgi:excisionase family DNA binding protein
MPTENSVKLLDAKELASIIGVHPVSVRRWVMLGQVPYRKIGRAVRFTQEDVQAIIGRPVAAGVQS